MANQQWAVIKDVPERWDAEWFDTEEEAIEAAKDFVANANAIAYVVRETHMVSVATKTIVTKTGRG